MSRVQRPDQGTERESPKLRRTVGAQTPKLLGLAHCSVRRPLLRSKMTLLKTKAKSVLFSTLRGIG